MFAFDMDLFGILLEVIPMEIDNLETGGQCLRFLLQHHNTHPSPLPQAKARRKRVKKHETRNKTV